MPSPPSTGCSPTWWPPRATCEVRSVGFCAIAETGALVDAGGRAVSQAAGLARPARWPAGGVPRPCARRGAALPHRPGGQLGRHPVQAALVARRGRPRPARPAVAVPARAGLPRPGRGAVRRAFDARPHRTVGHPRRDAVRGRARGARRPVQTSCRPGRRRCGAGPGARRPPRRAGTRRGADGRGARPPRRRGGARSRRASVSLCDSMGTAEALVAAVAAPPSPRVVAGLVSRGLSVYPHVVDSTTCLLGALRTGLVLGRTLDTLGATTIEQRVAFDAATPPGTEPADVTVEGLDMGDDHVAVGWPEGTTPHAAWSGVLARTRRGRRLRGRGDAGGRRAGRRRRRHRRLGAPALGAREPGRDRRARRPTWPWRSRAPRGRHCSHGGRPPGIRQGSDPTTHEAPQAGWFTDPSA